VAQDAQHAVSRPGIRGYLQGCLQPALAQQHVGVVHSSNLCTEITLNTATPKSRCAIWARSTFRRIWPRAEGGQIGVDHDKLKRTVGTAMRDARQRDRHQLLTQWTRRQRQICGIGPSDSA